jgi:hypothetical protein
VQQQAPVMGMDLNMVDMDMDTDLNMVDMDTDMDLDLDMDSSIAVGTDGAIATGAIVAGMIGGTNWFCW